MTDKEAMAAQPEGDAQDDLIERLKRTTDPVWQHTRDEVIQEAASSLSSSKARIEDLEAETRRHFDHAAKCERIAAEATSRLSEMENALEAMVSVTEAFLNKFNPHQLSEDKAQQWFAVFDQIGHSNIVRALRSKGETGASCELRAKGKPYPRTCPVCGLGPCQAIWE